MSINSQFLLRPALTVMVAATFAFTVYGSASAQEQEVGRFDFIQLLRDVTTSTSFLLLPIEEEPPTDVSDGSTGSLRLLSGFVTQVTLRDDAPLGAVSLGPKGLGIGLLGTTMEESNNAQAPLHVVGGSDNSFPGPFPQAGVLIEDRNTEVEDRNLLVFFNNGRTNILFTDQSDLFSSVAMTGGGGAFNFLSGLGVGINVPVPEARLHIRRTGIDQVGLMVESDDDVTETRNMIDVVNNGPMIQQFTDTSTADPGVFQLESRSDRFSVLQLGNRRAGFAVFEDGAVRFVADSQPNVTVTPNGSLNVVGSGPGGGNLRVGLGSNIGPNDGNIIAQGNITAVGNVNVGGVLNQSSDVNIKEGFQEIDAKEILRKVKNLPITRWNYIQDENDTAHIGPMAQDFAAAFKLGHSDKHISTIDSEGISLAAIKGLSLIMDEKDSTISAQADEIAKQADQNAKQADEISDLQSDLDEMKAELSELKSLLIEDFKEVKARVSTLN